MSRILLDASSLGSATWRCCGSMDKTTDSQSWGPQFESAGSGSSALGQGTLSLLPSPSEMT